MGLTLAQAVEKMRGKRRLPISTLAVRRGEEAAVRGHAHPRRHQDPVGPLALGRRDIGYVRITSFSQQSTTAAC